MCAGKLKYASEWAAIKHIDSMIRKSLKRKLPFVPPYG